MSLFEKKPKCDFLVVGLGNPGSEYEHTRHNAGFMTIDALANEQGGGYWKLRCDAFCCEIKINDNLILLAKPQTFMNRSGQSVKGLLKHTAIKDIATKLIIIHDDLDIAEHTVRLKSGGGHGGHNGLRDINTAISDSYLRIRVGIGRPPGKMPADKFVLQRISGDGLEQLQVDATVTAKAVSDIVKLGFLQAQNSYNAQ